MLSRVNFTNRTIWDRLRRWLQVDASASARAGIAPCFRWTRLVQIVAAAILTAALVILFNLSVVAWRTASFAPFGESSVQHLLNARTSDGMPVVSLSAHEPVRIEARKCYTQDVFTASSATWFERGGGKTIRGGSGDLRLRPAGCETIFYRNAVPHGVTPGVWQLRGVEVARATDWFGSLQQTRVWESEWFKVVE